jgi:hypothetical protein
MGKYHWTNKEVAVVKEHYASGGTKVCLPLLPGRSKGSISQQARKLGLMYGDNVPRPRQKWVSSDEIDRRIVECYRMRTEKAAVKRLAVSLGRPYWWVKKRASLLGVAQPVLTDNKEPEWSAAEMELLESNACKTPDVIARIFRVHGFKRTATAIVVKRKRLRCDTVDIDHYTATQLAGEFGVDIKVVTRWIERGWLKAGRRGTERKAGQGGDMWWIKRRAVRDFVVESIGIIDIRKVDKVWLVDLLANK